MNNSKTDSPPEKVNWFKAIFGSTLFLILIVGYIIIKCITMGLAGYLSWTCPNFKDNEKILHTVFAVLFSNIYIPYYIFDRYVMKHAC